MTDTDAGTSWYGEVPEPEPTIWSEIMTPFREMSVWAVIAVLSTTLGLTYAIGRAMPIKREVISYKVERVKQVAVPIPSGVHYQPLTNPLDACKGKPVIIVSTSVSESQNKEDKTTYTWLTVRPAGDTYTVACHQGGSYPWIVGDLVVLNGGVTG